jgi:hypothetical protein
MRLMLLFGWSLLLVTSFALAWMDAPEYPILKWFMLSWLVLMYVATLGWIGSRTPPWMLD